MRIFSDTEMYHLDTLFMYLAIVAQINAVTDLPITTALLLKRTLQSA